MSKEDRRTQIAKTARQVAVVAVRPGDGTHVCLIRRRDSGKWGIPKGFIDRGDSHGQAALTEALEEAGLLGRITGHAAGIYGYEKWDEDFLPSCWSAVASAASSHPAATSRGR